MTNNNDISCKIVEHIAVLSTNESGWQKELNRVSLDAFFCARC